jgi:amyloid beta precursor protein binding protein 1
MPFFRPYPARHQVPSEIATLFEDPAISPEALRQNPSPFFHLLAALKEFTDQSETHTLPLTSTLPDMKSDTSNYIHLQRLYKTRAEEETQAFKSHLRTHVDDATVDLFVKNAHALRVLRGKQWGAFDQDKAALGACVRLIPNSILTCGFASGRSGLLSQGNVHAPRLVRLVRSGRKRLRVTSDR